MYTFDDEDFGELIGQDMAVQSAIEASDRGLFDAQRGNDEDLEALAEMEANAGWHGFARKSLIRAEGVGGTRTV